MKIVIYTTIVGGYDDLVPAVSGHRCLLFTDTPGEHGPNEAGYEVIPLPGAEGEDPRDVSRAVKIMMPFNDYLGHFEGTDWSIYLDAHLSLVHPPKHYVSRVGDGEIGVMAHHRRSTVMEEVEACVRLGLVPMAAISQVQRYVENGLPDGLSAGGLLVRRHDSPSLYEAMKTWYTLYKSGFRRDQLSLDYALWVSGITPVRFREPWLKIIKLVKHRRDACPGTERATG